MRIIKIDAIELGKLNMYCIIYLKNVRTTHILSLSKKKECFSLGLAFLLVHLYHERVSHNFVLQLSVLFS